MAATTATPTQFVLKFESFGSTTNEIISTNTYNAVDHED